MFGWLFGSTKRTAPPDSPRATAHLSLGERRIKTKVVGVSFNNADGTRREDLIISKCREGDVLILKRDPRNKYDTNAIGVHLSSGEQIGHLSAALARDLASVMDGGERLAAIVRHRTGDDELDVDGDDDYSAGVNIEIFKQ
jgi:hypothetical protein